MGRGGGARRWAIGDAALLSAEAAAASVETQHAWFIYQNSSLPRMQGSYHVGNTASRLISEVKQR